MADHPLVFHLTPVGLLANRMIEYLVARHFAALVPGCRISNISLPEWDIHHPPIEPAGEVRFERRQQHIDVPGLAGAMLRGEFHRLDWEGYGQRLENLPPRAHCLDVFRPPAGLRVGYGPDVLVCHVRAGEILDGSNPDYPLTPASFYADVVAATGLRPVFIGQTAPNAYTDGLRARFPDAEFRPPQDIVADFETIRRSRHVVVGVSTYAWLAAWLSRSVETIHLTVSGLFNPMQAPNVALLPFDDPRYRFWLFPLNYGVPLHRHRAMHQVLQPWWRQMPSRLLQRQSAEAPRCERRLDAMLAAYDEAWYLAANGDVAAQLQAGHLLSGQDHYIRWGFGECRFPFPLDRQWYATQYPLAAFEVAQGDYSDFSHHYLAVGRQRGYRPLPP